MVIAMSADTRLVICDNCKKALLFNTEDETEVEVKPPTEWGDDGCSVFKHVIVCPSCGSTVETATHLRPRRIL